MLSRRVLSALCMPFHHIGKTLVPPPGHEPGCPKALGPKPSVSAFHHGGTSLVRRERLELSRHSLTSDSQPDASAYSAIGAQLTLPCEGFEPSRPPSGHHTVCLPDDAFTSKGATQFVKELWRAG